jgi:cytochrome P450
VVLASIWLAHTREATFPDPYLFRPERFLDGSPETYSWIPFGGGTRRCLGAAFAQLERGIVLRTVLREAVLATAGERQEAIVRRNVTLAPRHGTPAILRERVAV